MEKILFRIWWSPINSQQSTHTTFLFSFHTKQSPNESAECIKFSQNDTQGMAASIKIIVFAITAARAHLWIKSVHTIHSKCWSAGICIGIHMIDTHTSIKKTQRTTVNLVELRNSAATIPKIIDLFGCSTMTQSYCKENEWIHTLELTQNMGSEIFRPGIVRGTNATNK